MTLTFPDFYTKELKLAKFNDARTVYDYGKLLITKKSDKLNYKSLYPNKFDRQKVFLVDNTFHQFITAAMKDFNYIDTAHFLEIFRNWWNIVNNSKNVKGNRKRNEFSKPISNINDFRCELLKKYLIWLNSWKNWRQIVI